MILGISGSISSDEPQRLLCAGCDDIALKPFDINGFAKILQRIIPVNQFGVQEDVSEGESQKERVKPLDPQILDKYFRGDLLMWWKSVNSSMIFEEIEDFACEVCLRAKQCQAQEILEWGEALLAQARVFDIKKINVTIGLFPELCSAENLIEKVN